MSVPFLKPEFAVPQFAIVAEVKADIADAREDIHSLETMLRSARHGMRGLKMRLRIERLKHELETVQGIYGEQYGE